MFQFFQLLPTLTALENAMLPLDFGPSSSGDDRAARALRNLERVALGDKADHMPMELSGGEQQRVAIARALAKAPRILLCDEPTGELDFTTGVQILELLQEQAGNGRAVLVVTHNREISRMADRVVELSSGRIVGDGPPAGGRAPVVELHW